SSELTDGGAFTEVTTSGCYIWGPYKSLRFGQRAVGSTELEIKDGSGYAVVDISANVGKMTLKRSEKVRLSELGRHQITLDVSSVEASNVEYRLHLYPDDAMTIRVKDHSLRFSEDSSLSKIDSLLRIAHAGGSVDGKVLLNSRAALEENYKRGARFFELDFSWTADKRLVFLHDWNTRAERISEDLGSGPVDYDTFVKASGDSE